VHAIDPAKVGTPRGSGEDGSYWPHAFLLLRCGHYELIYPADAASWQPLMAGSEFRRGGVASL